MSDLFENATPYWQTWDLLRDECDIIPGGPTAKLLLMILYSKMGEKRQSWDEDLAEVARRCQCGVGTLREKIRELREASLIEAMPISRTTPRQPRYRFRIARANLADFRSEIQNADSEFQTPGSEFQNGDSEIQNSRSEIQNDTTYLQQNSNKDLQQKPPTTADLNGPPATDLALWGESLIARWGEIGHVTPYPGLQLSPADFRAAREQDSPPFRQLIEQAVEKIAQGPLTIGTKWRSLSALLRDSALAQGIVGGNYDQDFQQGNNDANRNHYRTSSAYRHPDDNENDI
jgi:hypothetical protein